MLELLQHLVTDTVNLPTPELVHLTGSVVGIGYTSYRVIFYGVPALYRRAARAAVAFNTWRKSPSQVQILREELQCLKRSLGA
jgi:hypothetical protein